MSNAIHQNRRALSATEVVTQLSKLNGEQALGWRLIDGKWQLLNASWKPAF